MAPSIWRMWISSADNPNSVRTAVVPWMCATKEDETPFYAPDIKEAHSGTVEYGKRRRLESKHPILCAPCTICFPSLNRNYIDTGTRSPEDRRHKGRDLTLADKMGMANDPSEVVLRQDSAQPLNPLLVTMLQAAAHAIHFKRILNFGEGQVSDHQSEIAGREEDI